MTDGPSIETLLAAEPSPEAGAALIDWAETMFARVERGDHMIGILSPAELEPVKPALVHACACDAEKSWFYLVGWCTQSPLGPDLETAERTLAEGAARGASGARRELVKLRWFFRRHEASSDEQAEALRLVTEADDPEALHLRGLLTCAGFGCEADPAAAFSLQQQAAAAGNLDAKFELYIHHASGLGVEADPAAAFRAAQDAAEAGHPRALYNMGAFHASGQGVEQSYERALEWYERASDAGNARATLTLAVMYATGQGTEPDRERAADLLGMAEHMGLDVTEVRVGLGL